MTIAPATENHKIDQHTKGFPNWLCCCALYLVILLGSTGCGINNIAIFEQAVNEAWIEVQSQYRDRAELVLQLMDVVGPMRSDQGPLFEQLEVAETRVFEMHIAPDTLEDPAAFSDFRQQQLTLTDVLQRVLLAAPDNAEIATNPRFAMINSALQENAQLIDIARRDYWQKVQRYNSELTTVPGRWWRAFVYPKAREKENFDEDSLQSG